MELIHCFFDGTDGIAQISVLLSSVFSDDRCWLGGDETLFFQYRHIFFDGVLAQIHCGTDGVVAWPALMGLAILAA